MLYLPHTSEDIASMLETIGVDDLDGLFSTVPEDCRFTGDLNLPEALTEWELNDHMTRSSWEQAATNILFLRRCLIY
jgi:glycine dehydrogenase subunit 1